MHPKDIKKYLIVGSATILILVAGVGFLIWQKNIKQTASNPTTGLEKQTVAEEEKNIEYQKKLQEIIDSPLLKDLSDAPRHATEDEQILGIIITKKGDKKFVVNEPQGYSIEVPSLLVMARTLDNKSVQFFDPETMCVLEACPANISIFIYEDEIKEYHKKGMDYLRNKENVPFETTVIGGKQGTKYFMEGDHRRIPSTWNYDLEVGDKAYAIGIGDRDPSWKDIINSFKLITAQP